MTYVNERVVIFLSIIYRSNKLNMTLKLELKSIYFYGKKNVINLKKLIISSYAVNIYTFITRYLN